MWTQASLKVRSNSLKPLSEEEKKRRIVEAFKKKNSLREELSDFFTETSFTAVVKIYNAKSLLKRLTWTLLVLSMVSWLAVQCYWLLDRYFQYPVEVKIDLKGAVSLKFPSVTFCNLNPIREEALSDPHYELLRQYKSAPTEDVLYQSLQENFNFGETCEADQYQCMNNKCIYIEWKCDTIIDCVNGDDEERCETWKCPANYWRCPNSHCILNTSRCDGAPDCMPGFEDEIGCVVGGTTGSYLHPSIFFSTPSPYAHFPTTPSFLGKRRKRDIGDEALIPEVRKQMDFYSLMKKGWERMHTKVKDGTVSADTYVKFVERQRRELKMRQGRLKTSFRQNVHRHHRSKRSGSGSSSSGGGTSREGIDWGSVLGNASFNKWDQLSAGNASEQFYAARDDEYEAAMTYAYVTAVLDPAYAELGGHMKKNFIVSCKFNGYQCSPNNFTYFHSHKYGNCYTFNANGKNRDLSTTFAGPSAGLRVELFLHQSQYVANLAPEAGVRVSIHEKGARPFPEDEGMSVPPKSSSSISMRQVILERLPPPHGECAFFGGTVNYYETEEGFNYTKLSCLKSCYQDVIWESCNCLSPVYHILENRTICNMTDPRIEKCIQDLSTVNVARYHRCDELCPQPCYEVRFDTSFSQAEWPSSKYENFFRSRVGKTNSLYLTSSEVYDFLRIQVYFEDFLFQHVKQQRAYESMNLISDLGGQLGLWLGLSAITIGEICTFLFRLGRSLPYSLSKKDEKEDVTKPKHKVGPVTLEEMYEDIAKEDTKKIAL